MNVLPPGPFTPNCHTQVLYHLTEGVAVNDSASWHIVNQNDTFLFQKSVTIHSFTDRLFSLSSLDTHLFSPNAYSLDWLAECSGVPMAHPQWLPDPICPHCACRRASEMVRMYSSASSCSHQSECKVPTNSWIFITATHCEWLHGWKSTSYRWHTCNNFVKYKTTISFENFMQMTNLSTVKLSASCLL